MVNKNASMYLGSPRMAEKVIGETITLEEMGGARMHTGESGCGDVLVKTEVQALDWARNYLSYLPSHCQEAPPSSEGTEPPNVRAIDEIIPPEQNKLFDVKQLIDELVDAGSFLEVKQRFARVGDRVSPTRRRDDRYRSKQLQVQGWCSFCRFCR